LRILFYIRLRNLYFNTNFAEAGGLGLENYREWTNQEKLLVANTFNLFSHIIYE